MEEKKRHYVLTVSCPDAVGLVAAVSGLIASWGGWLTEVANHADRVSGRFFMRNEVAADSLSFGLDGFRERFAPLAAKHDMRFEVRDSAEPRRVMILVSRQEQWLSTKGTTSTLSLASGEPPTGFRFVVTPRF